MHHVLLYGYVHMCESNISKPLFQSVDAWYYIRLCEFYGYFFQGVGSKEAFLPVPKVEEIPYQYQVVEIETYGPPAPSPEELESIG